jgi:hypothetical protein
MSRWQTNVDADVEARVVASADHREGDRVPIWDYIDNPAVFHHYRRGNEGPHVTMSRVYRELGIDLCRGYTLPFGSDEDLDVERTITTPQQLEQELEERIADEEWAAFGEELLRYYRDMRDNLAPRTMFVPGGGTGLTALYTAMGLQRFCLWLRDFPALIGAVLGRRARENARWARLVARKKLCPLFFLGEDIAGKNGPLFSPAWLRRHFFPALLVNIMPLKEAGIKVIFHSDGNLMEILDDLLDAGVDGINPIEPRAGMDIAELKRRYGDRLILAGNVDCSRVLPFGDVEDVRCAVKECVRAASPGGGHFLGSSGEITPDTPLENVLAFYEACHEFGRYRGGAHGPLSGTK